MTTRIKLGILTPSSNTALEPLTQALIASLNAQLTTHNITVHFSRFPVTKISLSPSGLAQFNIEPILAAAELLAHAEVDIIGWSGTSSGWLGFDEDDRLCEAIEQKTGIKATTSVLALNKVLELWGVKRLGFVTPYTDDVQAAIVKNYKGIGVEIGEGMERHLGVSRNNDFSNVTEDMLDEMMEDVCKAEVDAVSTFCTNLIAAHRVKFWEQRFGLPVFDTVTTVVWDMLRALDVDLKSVEGWGMIFKRA